MPLCPGSSIYLNIRSYAIVTDDELQKGVNYILDAIYEKDELLGMSLTGNSRVTGLS